MAKVEIVESLYLEIKKKFKKESVKVLQNLKKLEKNPKKGKTIGNVCGMLIKELKYKSFRFYFVTDGYKLEFYNEEELKNLLLKFVRMSDKDTQQKVIDEIKIVLKTLGGEGFR